MSGLSLIEVLVGVLLSSIIVLTLYEVLISQERVYGIQDDIAEMQQNLRVGVEKISRDITMAGFGKPKLTTVNEVNVSTWYNSANGYKPISPASGTASTINVLGCLDAADGSLTAAASPGATTLALKTGQADNFKKDGALDSKKADISIGGLESARIVGISGDTLTIDTDVNTAGNQGLLNAYASDTEIFIVRVVTYYADTDSDVPVLRMNENRGAGGQQLCQFVTGLQVTVTGNVADFTLSGRTRKPDRTTGQYVLGQVSTRVFLRNP